MTRSEREAAFRAAYDAHFSAVLGYCLRRTAQPADAADAVAETFATAWRRFDDAPPGDARPWLFVIARHVVANHHRSGRRRERLGARLRSTLGAAGTVHDGAGAVGSDGLDPMARSDERDRIGRALDGLSADDRELVMLVGWDGLTPTEAADALGLKPGTARMRLARARARLRELLGEQEQAAAAQHAEPQGDAAEATGHVQGEPIPTRAGDRA